MSDAKALLKGAQEAQYKEVPGDEAFNGATEALKLFKKSSDMDGIADSLTIILEAMVGKNQITEAKKMAEDELATFKQKGNKAGEAKMLLSLAQILDAAGSEAQRDQALDKAEEALKFFQSSGDKKNEANTQVALYNIHAKRKLEKSTAVLVGQCAEEAVALFKELGDLKGEGTALHGVAVSSVMVDQYDAAIEVGQSAAELFSEAGIDKKKAYELMSIASWYVMINKEEEAIAAAKEAMTIYIDISAGCEFTGKCAKILAEAFVVQDEFDQALKYAKQQLQLCRDQGNKKEETVALQIIMETHMKKGDLHHALRRAQEAAKVAEGDGDKKMEAEALIWVCKIRAMREQHEEALQAGNQAVSLGEELGDKELIASSYKVLTLAYQYEGDMDKALEVNTKAVDLMEEAGLKVGKALALQEGVEVLVNKDDKNKAIAYAREAATIMKTEGDSVKEVTALKVLAAVYDIKGETESAIKTMERARIINKEIGNKMEEAGCLVSISMLSLAFVRAEEERLGTRASRSITQRLDKGFKAAKEAVSIGKRLKNDRVKGEGLIAQSQLELAKGKDKDALINANEACNLFRDLGLLNDETTALNLCANAWLNLGDKERAKEDAEEALQIAKTLDYKDGEKFAEEILELATPKVMPAMFDPSQQMQFEQFQQMQAMQNAAGFGGGGGGGMQMAPMSMDFGDMGGGAMVKMGGKPSVAGLEGKAVKEKVRALAMEIIGLEPDELEDDSPLMEVGLTSSASVLLRDALSEAMPGINLPFTLVFDFPTVIDLAEHLELKG